MLSRVSELELAKIFVYSKKEKIEKLLNITELDAYTASEKLFYFIRDNQDAIWGDYENKYNPIFDEVFFVMVIDFFRSLQKQGTSLEGPSQRSEPNITYVS